VIDRYVLVVPSVIQSPAGCAGWQELLITTGFFGLWGLRLPVVRGAVRSGESGVAAFEAERRHHPHTADG